MTPSVSEALAEARRHGDLAERARQAMVEHARARRAAIWSAHCAGLSIRRIAAELGCSPTVVQSAVTAARDEKI
jgi:DNA-directed RNA polymerase specialized sigma24 family protein